MPRPSPSDKPVAPALRVSPTLAVPVMVGAPVAGVLGGGGAAATAPVTALVSDSSLPPSSVKLTLTPDGLARVGVGQGVGGSGCPVDLSVVGEPLVGEGSVAEAVAVGYAGGNRSKRVPNLGRAVMVGNPVAGVLGVPVGGEAGPATAN